MAGYPPAGTRSGERRENRRSRAAPRRTESEGDRAGDKAGRGPREELVACVHTYSGHEHKAKLTLLERVRNGKSSPSISSSVLVPDREREEVVKGQRRTTTRKLLPGLLFVAVVLFRLGTFHFSRIPRRCSRASGRDQPTPGARREITGSRQT